MTGIVKTMRKHNQPNIVIFDVTEITNLISNRKEVLLLNVYQPTRFVIDILLHRYPYMDNSCLLIHILSTEEYRRKVEHTEEELTTLKDFYHEVGILLHRHFIKYVRELDLYSYKHITWLDDTSVIMERI